MTANIANSEEQPTKNKRADGLKRFAKRTLVLGVFYIPLLLMAAVLVVRELAVQCGMPLKEGPAEPIDPLALANTAALFAISAWIVAAFEGATGLLTVLSLYLTCADPTKTLLSSDLYGHLPVFLLIVNIVVYAAGGWLPSFVSTVLRLTGIQETLQRTPAIAKSVRTVAGCFAVAAVAVFAATIGVKAMTSHVARAVTTSIPCRSTNFAVNLFNNVSDDQGNTLVSPFGAYSSLCLMANGASGDTRHQMERVLGSTNGLDSANQRNHAVLSMLNADNGATEQLNIANAVYADSKTAFRPSFLNMAHDTYGAEIHSIDFADSSEIGKINRWCQAKTHGKIASIIDHFEPLEKLAILNAVYFKSAWKFKFDPAKTDSDTFTSLSGSSKPVQMMHQTTHLKFRGERNFNAVALPYDGEHQSMYILLPDAGVKWAEFRKEITSKNLHDLMKESEDKNIVLSLPRFHLTYETNLAEKLKTMGMATAFSPHTADFSALVDAEHSWISRVLQKAYMDVNEDGTEAAAMTANQLNSRNSYSANHDDTIKFIVDRPFVLVLVDNDTKEILFIGSVVDM